MSEQINKFKEELQEHGLRVTQSRIAVFSVLEKSKRVFLSPDEVYESILDSRDFSCDRASVYRVLGTLEKIGLVKVSHFQGEASKYQVHHHGPECGDCGNKHEHYFKCLICGSIDSIGACFIDEKVTELEKKGFRTLSHHLEISGHCPNCK